MSAPSPSPSRRTDLHAALARAAQRRANHRLALHRAETDVERYRAAIRADGERIDALLEEMGT